MELVINKDMIRSEAFQDLSFSAAKLLILAWAQVRGQQLHTLELPHSWAKRIGLKSSKTITQARQELVDKGFLNVRKTGSLLRGASLFELSDNWRHYRRKPKPAPAPPPKTPRGDEDEPFQLRLVQGGKA